MNSSQQLSIFSNANTSMVNQKLATYNPVAATAVATITSSSDEQKPFLSNLSAFQGDDAQASVKKSSGRPPGKRKHIAHEFLMKQLDNENNTDIVWTDKKLGKFTVTNSKSLAKSWGDATGIPNMDWNKMACRIHYCKAKDKCLLSTNHRKLQFQFNIYYEDLKQYFQ